MAKKPKIAEEGGKTSVEDIAATLLTGAVAAPSDDDTSEDEEDVVDTSEQEEDDDQSPTGGEETEDEVEDEGEDPEDVEEASDDEEESEIEYLEITDSDLIAVTVDGEEQEVSIGDLKRAYSGEGAIEKRLQEATEARKKSVQSSTALLEKLADDERQLAEAVNGLDENLFKGVIPPPSDDLRNRDPKRYLQHQEAYQKDQERIADAKLMLKEAQEKAAAARAERLKLYAQQSSQIIAQEIPELVSNDEKVRQTTFEKMVSTAMAYGYSEKEIQSALDPRMFMLVRDAMKYRDMMSATTGRDPKDVKGQAVKKVRRLRSGNTLNKNRARQTDRVQKAKMEKARQTGNPKDVAETLLVSKPKR